MLTPWLIHFGFVVFDFSDEILIDFSDKIHELGIESDHFWLRMMSCRVV